MLLCESFFVEKGNFVECGSIVRGIVYSLLWMEKD